MATEQECLVVPAFDENYDYCAKSLNTRRKNYIAYLETLTELSCISILSHAATKKEGEMREAGETKFYKSKDKWSSNYDDLLSVLADLVIGECEE